MSCVSGHLKSFENVLCLEFKAKLTCLVNVVLSMLTFSSHELK